MRNSIRKLLVIIAVVLLVVAMALTVYAVTPTLNIPDVPNISNIKFDINLDETLNNGISNYISNWFKEHPLTFSKIDFSEFRFN